MTPEVHRVADATAFQPEGHQEVSPVRPTGTATGETLGVVLSTYEPGAHAEWSPMALDTVCVLQSGRSSITLEDGAVQLGHLDSVFLPDGCLRAVDNLTSDPGSMLVIRPVA
ncbi:MAG: hypothetical protein ACR2M5_10095 [Nakamurella sp.]